MPIKRWIGQGSSLRAFYDNKERWKHPGFKETAEGMLEIIDWLNKQFPKTPFYGMTSHLRLHLLKDNIEGGKIYVTISYSPINRHHISYRMPEQEAPWKGAEISGTATSIDEFKKFILLAIKNCEGWASSEEIQLL